MTTRLLPAYIASMPDTGHTPAQARLMMAVAHGWKPDRVKAPPKKVAREYVEAKKGTPLLASAARGAAMKRHRTSGSYAGGAAIGA